MTEQGATAVPNRDIQEMVYHTDARVTAMEGRIGGMDQKLDTLISSITTPKEQHMAAWVMAGLMFLGMIIAGALGLGQYISLVNEPAHQDIEHLSEKLGELSTWQHQTHYEFGVIHTENEGSIKDRSDLRSKVEMNTAEVALHAKEIASLQAHMAVNHGEN